LLNSLIRQPVITSTNHGARKADPAALQRITEQIDALERTPVRSRTYVRYSELFRWPLAVMLVAGVIWSLLSKKSRAS
jgi:hypothetical protein